MKKSLTIEYLQCGQYNVFVSPHLGHTLLQLLLQNKEVQLLAIPIGYALNPSLDTRN